MHAYNATCVSAVVLLLILQFFDPCAPFNWHGPFFRDYEYPELQLLLTAKEEINNSKDEENNSNGMKISAKGGSSPLHSDPSDIVDVLLPKQKIENEKLRPWMKSKYADHEFCMTPKTQFAVKSKVSNFKISMDNDNIPEEQQHVIISARSIRPQTTFVTEESSVNAAHNSVTSIALSKTSEDAAQQSKSPNSLNSHKPIEHSVKHKEPSSSKPAVTENRDTNKEDAHSSAKLRDNLNMSDGKGSARNEEGQDLDEDNEEDSDSPPFKSNPTDKDKEQKLSVVESNKVQTSNFVQNNKDSLSPERRKNTPTMAKRNHYNKQLNTRSFRRAFQNAAVNISDKGSPRALNNTNAGSSTKLAPQRKGFNENKSVRQYETIVNVDSKASETLVKDESANAESSQDSNRKIMLVDSQSPSRETKNPFLNEKCVQNSTNNGFSKFQSIQNNRVANSKFSLPDNGIPLMYPIPDQENQLVTPNSNGLPSDIVARAPIKLLAQSEKKAGKSLANSLPFPDQKNPLQRNVDIAPRKLELKEDIAINPVAFATKGHGLLEQYSKELHGQYNSNATNKADRLSIKRSLFSNNSESKHVLLKKSLNLNNRNSQYFIPEEDSNSHDDNFYSLSNSDAPTAKLSALLYKVKDKRNLINMIKRKKINRPTTSVKRSVGDHDSEYENYEYDSSPNSRPASQQDYEYDEEYDTEYDNSRAFNNEDSQKRLQSDQKRRREKDDETDEYYFYIDQSNNPTPNKNVVSKNHNTKELVPKNYDDLFAHPLNIDDPELEVIHGDHEQNKKMYRRKQLLPKRRRLKPAEQLKEVGYKDYSQRERKLIEPAEDIVDRGQQGEYNTHLLKKAAKDSPQIMLRRNMEKENPKG